MNATEVWGGRRRCCGPLSVASQKSTSVPAGVSRQCRVRRKPCCCGTTATLYEPLRTIGLFYWSIQPGRRADALQIAFGNPAARRRNGRGKCRINPSKPCLACFRRPRRGRIRARGGRPSGVSVPSNGASGARNVSRQGVWRRHPGRHSRRRGFAQKRLNEVGWRVWRRLRGAGSIKYRKDVQ
jgi:hypothetical protein